MPGRAKPEERHGCGRLARAGLADDRQRAPTSSANETSSTIAKSPSELEDAVERTSRARPQAVDVRGPVDAGSPDAVA